MRYRVFFFYLILFLSGPALAESFSSVEDLRRQVEIFLRVELQTEYAGTDAGDIEISVANLDPRLQLPECGAAVQHRVASPRPYGTHISVKTQCEGAKPWTIYVPARIDIYAPVVVAARSLERGSVLTAEDMTLNRMNTLQAGAGHTRVPADLVGMELKRRLDPGEPVRMLHLKAPQLVRKGERVVLEAGGAGVSVVTAGRALADGKRGDQIQVRNEKSQRIVDAEVVAPGRVRVAL